MDVFSQIHRNVVVDDMGYVGDINASGDEVRANQSGYLGVNA